MPGFTDKKYIFNVESHEGPPYHSACQKILELL